MHSENWSLEELRRSIVDSAEDYDRIVKSMKENESEERKEKKPSEE
tara:strand:+ start:1428 stop:1565 length:138 start_codon:yes stop_codon:yes gene_type:complete